jgi:hypothetical protein
MFSAWIGRLVDARCRKDLSGRLADNQNVKALVAIYAVGGGTVEGGGSFPNHWPVFTTALKACGSLNLGNRPRPLFFRMREV